MEVPRNAMISWITTISTGNIIYFYSAGQSQMPQRFFISGSDSQTLPSGSGVMRHRYSVRPMNKWMPIMVKYNMTKRTGIRMGPNRGNDPTNAFIGLFRKGISWMKRTHLNNLITRNTCTKVCVWFPNTPQLNNIYFSMIRCHESYKIYNVPSWPHEGQWLQDESVSDDIHEQFHSEIDVAQHLHSDVVPIQQGLVRVDALRVIKATKSHYVYDSNHPRD